METLIELALLAAAAYGVKLYFFTPESIQNREIFSSRGATLAKRLINGQRKQAPEIKADSRTQYQEESVTDNQPSLESITINPTEMEETPESSALETTEQLAVSQATIMEQPEKTGLLVPEDSVLKRHYFALLAAEQSNIKNPYPTDSVLRRHYDQKQIASLYVNTKAPVTEIEDETSLSESANLPSQEVQGIRIIPQDSVLRRHFLSQLQAQIESRYSPCPTDSTLKRHHRQLVQSQINACLSEFA